VAALLADVDTAIERATADISAAEAPGPLLDITVLQKLAIQLFVLGAAEHFGLYLSTITARINLDLTRSAKTFMTRPTAGVLTTR
jgi:hypothetical protein